ncbi:MAG: ketol-acid reductoisomerase [Candidatus Zixiibacteriota bacterium]
MKVYRDKDADIPILREKSLAVVGYGNQGSAFAKNLRDSGLNVSVALPESSRTIPTAISDGFPVISNDDVHRADIILMMLPDHLHGEFCSAHLDRRLNKGQCLVFAHGYSIHFGLVSPPNGILCSLVAPHGPGKDLRAAFKNGDGISCFVAAHPEKSAASLRIAVAIAYTIGCTRMGAFKTTFAHETLGDLFGEQALLCGGLTHLTMAVFETLIANGIPAENAYLETAHQLELLAGLIRKHGISGMLDRISRTAQFGTVIAESLFANKKLKTDLQKLFDDVASGRFTDRWSGEYRAGYPQIREFKRRVNSSRFEKTSRKMRKILPDESK